MKDQALIGLRGPPEDRRLVIRLRSRKNLPNGCIMSRPCFCSLPAPAAKGMCPVHSIWPCIAQRTKPGGNLPPSSSATNLNATIKAVFAKLLVERAEQYSPRGFRRGAAQELKESGSQWVAIATMGDWESLAFLGYADLTYNVERDMAKIRIETDPMDSDEEQVLTLG